MTGMQAHSTACHSASGFSGIAALRQHVLAGVAMQVETQSQALQYSQTQHQDEW